MAKDIKLDMIDRAIEQLGYGTPEYHEAMAFYCMTIAKRQWILAEQARDRKTDLRRRGGVKGARVDRIVLDEAAALRDDGPNERSRGDA